MDPAAEFLIPPPSCISVSCTTEVRALPRVVSQRQAYFRCCGEILACQALSGGGVPLCVGVLYL